MNHYPNGQPQDMAYASAVAGAEYAKSLHASGLQTRNPNAPPEQPDTVLSAAVKNLAAHNDFLADQVERLERLQSRIFGPEPQSGETGPTAPKPIGAIYELSGSLDRGKFLANRLAAVVSSLEKIA